MKIYIMVEGPTDKLVMEQLLKPWARGKATLSVAHFEGKQRLLRQGLERAQRFLEAGEFAHAFALPDLYPPTLEPGPLIHSNAKQLRAVMRKRLPDRRFHPHCLVHDLESLILARPERLKSVLKTDDKIENGWSRNAEKQNHGKPPKTVVNGLFKKHLHREYRDSIHAPPLLADASMGSLAKACPEGFGRFVNDLATILGLPLTSET